MNRYKIKHTKHFFHPIRVDRACESSSAQFLFNRQIVSEEVIVMHTGGNRNPRRLSSPLTANCLRKGFSNAHRQELQPHEAPFPFNHGSIYTSLPLTASCLRKGYSNAHRREPQPQEAQFPFNSKLSQKRLQYCAPGSSVPLLAARYLRRGYSNAHRWGLQPHEAQFPFNHGHIYIYIHPCL